jgi:hypothetical protein
MKRPHYNRKPDGPWRDSGDRRELLPEIDPNWRRRRIEREPAGNAWLPIGIGLLVLSVVGYAKVQRGATEVAALLPMPAASPADPEGERRARLMAEQEVLRRSLEDQRLATVAEQQALGSINGRQIHRCAYAGTESLQSSPCVVPWVEVAQGGDESRWQRVQEQEQMRLAAEARLAEEQRRLQAAIGVQQAQVRYSAPAASGSISSSRCAMAKAERDEAYRVAGNNRRFEFIRWWTDYVFEACKQ